jgi:hypothetical protein
MSTANLQTFSVDCHICQANVAAIETGRAEEMGPGPHSPEPCGERVLVGRCPRCRSILVGHSIQIAFEGVDAARDRWSKAVHVFRVHQSCSPFTGFHRQSGARSARLISPCSPMQTLPHV